MIGILGKSGPPDEAVARAAQSAVPYPTPEMRFLRKGDVLLGIATRPDFRIESMSADGEMVAVLTGRIDNAAELYSALTAEQHRPVSTDDADVVVAAFRAWGTMAVNRFRGAFAGLVTDGRMLHCFRDHMGFRSLFFRNDERQFVVAGEARPVAVAAGIAIEPDLDVVRGIVFFGQPSHTPAALKGVNRQPQTTVISIGVSVGIRTDLYWFPAQLLETLRITEAEAHERFRALLAQAVARCMVGRSALYLSGGLDSPAVAAFAAPEHLRRTGAPLGAISAVFPELADVDESALVRLVADRFGMPLHTYRPSARVLDDAVEWGRRLSSPVPTLSIPEVWDSYSLARSLGYESVMTGEFAEVTYGKWIHLLPHLFIHGRWGALKRVVDAEHARGASRRELLQDALTALIPGRVINWYLKRGAPRAIQQLSDWHADRSVGHPVPRADYLVAPWQRWRDMQLAGTTGSTITLEADATVATMAGVVSRRPFADIDLWEFFLGLPGDIKFPVLQWKALARRALRGVIPDEILDKPKKTYFDSHVRSQLDYPLLRRIFATPAHAIAGIDYDRLRAHLDAEDLGFYEWIRVRELAKAHAFLESF